MAYQKFTTAGTYFLKDGPSYVRNISCPNAGTTSTFVINSIGGPAGAGAVAVIGGTTPFPISVGVALNSPIFVPYGLQLVLGGTVGEFDLDFV
jgi:hypothetical protein